MHAPSRPVTAMPEKPQQPSIDQMDADAETAATFLRLLRRKGTPAAAAVQITCKYLETLIIARTAAELPREPWEEKP